MEKNEENIILFQSRNKGIDLNAHLLKDYLTDDPHCLHSSYDFDGNAHYYLECPRYTQQRDILSHQICDIGAPFQINFILSVRSEYLHNLNFKIIFYVHNNIK